MADDDIPFPRDRPNDLPSPRDSERALVQWLERELPIYLTQAGHGATIDEFTHHVWKLLPTKPEISWLFGLHGYLDCGDLDTIIEAVWERRR